MYTYILIVRHTTPIGGLSFDRKKSFDWCGSQKCT